MTSPRLRRSAACVALLAFAAAPALAQKRDITEKDLLQFVWVADPQISPDGSQVVFVRVAVDEKKDQYDTSLWIARTDGAEAPRQLTVGTRDTGPRWSPDGRRIAFVRAVEKDGRPQPPQLHVLAMDGGEARAITDMPRGAGNPQWSPDGRTIAFSSSARPDELNKDDGKGEQKDKPRVSDVRVVTNAVYRANGVADFGYVDPDRPSHIWTVAVSDTSTAPASPKQITSGEFAEGNFQWTADGARLTFVSTRVKEPYYQSPDSDLYSVAAAGGELTKVASIEGTIGDYAFSPDGTRLAFVGTLAGAPVRSYSESDLWVMDLPSGAPRNLTAAYDFDVDGGLGGDQRAPRGAAPSGPVWSRDGRTIFVKVGEQGDANLKRIDAASGKVDAVTTGKHDLMAYSADAQGQKFAAVLSSQTVLGDLHVVDAANGDHEEALVVQRRALRAAEAVRAGGVLVHQLRRQEDSGMDPETAVVRRVAQVPAHPRDPWRTALGLRQHLHPRVPVDGREGLCGALHQPARQLELRTGLRQHHPVPLPGRRLQGPDGRGGRGPEEGLRR